MVPARPERVGEYADAQSCLPQGTQEVARVRIGERVRIPGLKVGRQRRPVAIVGRVDAAGGEDVIEGAGAVGPARGLLLAPQRHLGRRQAGRKSRVSGVVDEGVGRPLLD